MDTARNRPEDLFAALDVNVKKYGRKYIGCCPVHGGDSPDSLNFFPDGRKNKAFWLCLSNHCERSFDGSLLGFVQGVLSHQELGWESPDDTKRKVPRQRAVEWLCSFLQMPWEDIKADLSVAQRNQFISSVEAFTYSTPTRIQKGICSQEKLRSFLEIPAKYYIERGYSPEILNRYDVGLCMYPESNLYGRVVVPIYSDDGQYVIGCIGRSTNPQCMECGKYHHPNQECFTPNCKMLDYVKWRCSNRFNDKNFLYNYWNANKFIIKANRTIIVVEGCGDVWRLEEADIHNAVALNGSDLTDPQQIALECSGATHILCLTDNDKAGERAYQNMAKKCWFAKTTRLTPVGVKDVGELSTDDPLFDYIKEICHANRNI